MDKEKTLQNLRTKIDSIDSEIFELLKTRLSVVKQVGEFKAGIGQGVKNGDSIIRSGREADMVRGFYKKSLENGFDEKTSMALSYLWRVIISLSVNYEQETKIAISSGEGSINVLVREYFGFFSEVKNFKDNKSSLDSVLKGESTIAVIEASDSDKFSALKILTDAKYSSLKIFAALPFFEKATQPKAFCIAKLTPEQSGNDIFVYVDGATGQIKLNDSTQSGDKTPLGSFAIF